MRLILNFILADCLFLFEEYGFRFSSSLVSKSFGGDAFVVLVSGEIGIRIVSDRAQIFMDFQNVRLDKNNWTSIDLVRRLITGETELITSLVDQENKKFFKENVPKILDAFSAPRHADTQRTIKKLIKIRSNQMAKR